MTFYLNASSEEEQFSYHGESIKLDLHCCSNLSLPAEKQLPVVGDDTLNPILASKSSHAVGQDSGWEAGTAQLSQVL